MPQAVVRERLFLPGPITERIEAEPARWRQTVFLHSATDGLPVIAGAVDRKLYRRFVNYTPELTARCKKQVGLDLSAKHAREFTLAP